MAHSAVSTKINQYYSLSLNTCIELAKVMGVPLDYSDYATYLMNSADLQSLSSTICKEYGLTKSKYKFEDVGYDMDLIEVLLDRISKTMSISASSFDQLSLEIQDHISNKAEDAQEEYKTLSELVKQLISIGTKKDLHTTLDLEMIMHIQTKALVKKYMKYARKVLPAKKYVDVKAYEKLLFALLSQYNDLYEIFEKDAMMDVADLYIGHGEYAKGDSYYNYLIRENKDNEDIYYRHVKIYSETDYEVARNVAKDALHIIGQESENYLKIMEILVG